MNWIAQLQQYQPQDATEQTAKTEILQAVSQYGTAVLERTSPSGGHICCSGMILDASMKNVLLVYHNIYQSFSWTGGHADGDDDFLAVAIREAQEETSLQQVQPLCSAILSLDVLPVKAHEKRGVPVAAHKHYCVSFGLLADPRQPIHNKPDENSAVAWKPISELHTLCNEPHMLPVYEKLIARMRQVQQEQQQILQQMVSPLLTWYKTHARDLPWRKDRAPYHVWISEIMLQQTRVEAVKVYYARFLQTFPTIQALAEADPEAVRKCWEGLGYYTRARNLQRAAQEILQQYGGVFPTRQEDVLSLPGIGAYTAGAICSICFEQPTPAVDGNVLRVVMRLQDAFSEIDRNDVKKAVTEALRVCYPAGNCGAFTQALMELGALVCIPNGAPHCDLCPVATLCRSRAQQSQAMLPVRKKKKPRRIEQRTVWILHCGDAYAVCQRPEQGLLAGLWEFPNQLGILTEEEAIRQATAWGCKPVSIEKTVQKTHIFTHIEWHMSGIYLACQEMPSQFIWKTAQQLETEITLPTAFRMFWHS
jgi:A/G-specific adenine glycosylase